MQPLTDLLENFRVYALCVPCGRMEPVDLKEAIAQLGQKSTVTDLRRRVRCRECAKRRHDIRVVYVGPTERPATFRYER